MNDKRRILVIGIHQRYMNATNSLLPSVFSRCADTFFFGPGYSDETTLDKGVDAYINDIGGVDLIFVAASCIIKANIDKYKKFLSRYTAVFNQPVIKQKFFTDVESFCKRNHEKVIAGISDIDPHTTSQETIEALDCHARYFLGWGNGFLINQKTDSKLNQEVYIKKQIEKGFKVGLLGEFANNNKSRFINLGHIVTDSEFYWGALAARKFDVAVPGSGYSRRKLVTDRIKSMDDIAIAKAFYSYLFKIADRMKLKPFANFYGVNLYNLAFQKLLSQSKSCVTEGGANDYPVRKFLEIPASGALMVCWPATGLENLGFVSGKNCVFVDSNDAVEEVVKQVATNSEDFEEIARQGQQLVLDNHTTSARSSQLNKVLPLIEANQYAGSAWQNGEFSAIRSSDNLRQKVVSL